MRRKGNTNTKGKQYLDCTLSLHLLIDIALLKTPAPACLLLINQAIFLAIRKVKCKG